MRAVGGETIIFQSEPQRDPFGDPIPGTGESFTVRGCATWPAGSSEESFRGAAVSDNRIAVVPRRQFEVTSTMTATVGGRVYKVEGQPQEWRDLRGTPRGTQLTLRYDGTSDA